MRYFFIKVSFFIIAISLSWNSSALAQDPRYAAIVIDDATGKILHAENAHDRRHPASLTKKMTLYILFEALRARKITLKTRFTTSQLATKQIPCKLGLQFGQTISVEEIIKGMVTKSANDAAVVLAEGLAGSLVNFVALMNKKAKKLGMKGTRFYNASGVPDARQITTAMDMAILARALYHDFPQYYHYFQTKHFHYNGVAHRNHNQMLGAFHGLDGIKTGFVNASGFNISTSASRRGKNNRPCRLFAVVMGGQSWRSRDKRAAELLEDGFYRIGASREESLNVLPIPHAEVRIKTADAELQPVSYKGSQKKALEQSIAQTSVVNSPAYGSNDAQLLETSLKSEGQPYTKPALLSLPNIIEPNPEAASKTAQKRTKLKKAEVVPVAVTVDNQRTLPPGWVVPAAPASVKKNTPAAVRLKKSR